MSKRVQKKSAQAQKQSKPRARPKAGKTKTKDPFRMALLDPFNEMADGARVPDLFSAPTETRTFSQAFNVNADGNGNLDFVGYANPKYPGLSYRGCIVGGNNFVYAANSAVTQTNAVPTGTGTDLQNEFANYRVVGWGMKVSCISNLTTTSGSVTLASLPYAGYVPHEIVIGGQTHSSGNSGTMAEYWAACGLPVNGNNIDVARVSNLDHTITRAATSLAVNPLEFASRPIDPRAYNFRMSGDFRLGYDIQGQTSTTFINAGNASQADASGWLIPVLTGTGFAPSSSALRVEIIYHLEGTPGVLVSTMNSGSTSESPVDFQAYVNVLTEASKVPVIRTLATTALSSFGLSPLAHLIS